MALPIKETPILYGKESDKFLKEIRDNENKKVPEAEYNQAIEIYKKVMENINQDYL